MNRYSFFLCATLALHTAQTCTTHATRIVRATPALLASRPGIHARRALHRTAQLPAGSTTPENLAKSAALLFLKKACAYSCVGSATFFAGHEWGKQKGLESGVFVGEAHATAQISNQISDRALAWADRCRQAVLKKEEERLPLPRHQNN